MTTTVPVKISARSARQRFHGCEPDYIANVCKGACCRSSTAPSGILVMIHRSEAEATAAIRDLGGDVVEETGYVTPRPGERRCPAQTASDLCGLHGTPAKPFGCIASPFTLNGSGTLVIRNRYRLLRCFGTPRRVDLGDPADEDPLPAYVAFRGSLDRIFGEREAERICAHLAAGGGDLSAAMPYESYRLLRDNDHARHTAPKPGQTTPTPRGRPMATTEQIIEAQAVPVGPRWIEYRRAEDVEGAPINPKLHDRAAIRASIVRHGFADAPFLDERTGRLIAGHGRIDELLAMEAEGLDVPDGIVVDPDGRWTLPIQRGWASADDEHAETMLLSSNMTVEAGGWNEVERAEMLRRVAGQDEEILRSIGFDRARFDGLLAGLSNPTGVDDGWDDGAERPSLRDRFLVPPFDVLDARQGWWTSRKKAWMRLGIRSEIGRAVADPDAGTSLYRKGNPNATLLTQDSGRDAGYYRKKRAVESRLGRELTTEEYQRDYYVNTAEGSSVNATGTSIFDPVLCELVYRWYTAPGDLVLDPLAGGSVRGVVAGLLGRDYLGFDLAAEQIEANEAQVAQIVGPAGPDRGQIRYGAGDCRDLLAGLDAESTDAVLTCPPYLSLERYSDDPRDLSTMSVADFRTAVRAILAGTYRALRPDRFAVWVVGLVRLPDGRGVVDLRAMIADEGRAVGFIPHNQAVLVTLVGSLAVRAPQSFQARRTLGHTYQDVVVLVKGDASKAAKRLGEIDLADPVELGLAVDDEP